MKQIPKQECINLEHKRANKVNHKNMRFGLAVLLLPALCGAFTVTQPPRAFSTSLNYKTVSFREESRKKLVQGKPTSSFDSIPF